MFTPLPTIGLHPSVLPLHSRLAQGSAGFGYDGYHSTQFRLGRDQGGDQDQHVSDWAHEEALTAAFHGGLVADAVG